MSKKCFFAGEDLFAALLPAAVVSSVSQYEELKSQLRRDCQERIDAHDFELQLVDVIATKGSRIRPVSNWRTIICPLLLGNYPYLKKFCLRAPQRFERVYVNHLVLWGKKGLVLVFTKNGGRGGGSTASYHSTRPGIRFKIKWYWSKDCSYVSSQL